MQSDMKLIAMLHLCPLEDFGSWSAPQRLQYETALINDLNIIRDGGIRHLMVENNFDRELGDSLGDRAALFEHLLDLVCRTLAGADVVLGVCCRWADWGSTFRFIRQFDLAFCRLPLVGMKIVTRGGKLIETTYCEIEEGPKQCEFNPPIILCDLTPKNCQILSDPQDIDDRVSNLRSCGATGLIIGERRSGDYLREIEYDHLATSQRHWRLPAYVAGSIDDVRARSLSARGIGVIVGGFIYRCADPGSHRGVDEERLRRVVAAVQGR